MKIKYLFIGAVLLFIYMLPYFVFGEDAYITIHDYLDQDVAIIANLKNNGILTSITGTVPNMEGLDRSLFQSFTPFDVKMLCCYLLPSYWAIIVYTFLLKYLAFIGMFLLVDTYIMKSQHRWITTWISIMLAVVPFYVLHGISGVGLPMVIYAFLNLYFSKKIMFSYFLISVYTFNSWLAYGGFFALAILFILLCWDYYKNRTIHKHIIYGAALMCIVYIIANWGTIYSMFFSQSFVSQRTEWNYSTSLANEVIALLILIIFSNYHAGSLLAAPILIIFCYILWKYHKKYPQLKNIAILYLLIIAGVVGGTILKHLHIHLFVEVQFDRFYFFYPVIIILMLASCCMVLISENKKSLTGLLILFGFLSVISFDGEFRNNVVMRMIGTELRSISLNNVSDAKLFSKIDNYLHKERPSFGQFYDTDLFSKIHKDLGTKRDYTTKVVSVGIFPSVSEFNGFYTLDSYRVNYPVDYKHKFRKVIAKELDKNTTLKSYYDDWGSRCYVFSSELDIINNRYLCSKKDNISIEHLDIDVNVLKDIGCKYIISSVNINNYEDLNLAYVNSYSSDQSFWNIRVYRLQ